MDVGKTLYYNIKVAERNKILYFISLYCDANRCPQMNITSTAVSYHRISNNFGRGAFHFLFLIRIAQTTHKNFARGRGSMGQDDSILDRLFLLSSRET